MHEQTLQAGPRIDKQEGPIENETIICLPAVWLEEQDNYCNKPVENNLSFLSAENVFLLQIRPPGVGGRAHQA